MGEIIEIVQYRDGGPGWQQSGSAKKKHRGCGVRVPGGVYLETKLSENGNPITPQGYATPFWDTLACPPIPIDPVAMGVSPIGCTFIERDGVTHVIDWIGSEHYPNVADYIEEARVMGISRRISRSAEFHRLTAKSKLLLVHARAQVDHADLYKDFPLTCPRSNDGDHRTPEKPMCAGVYWHDIDPDTHLGEDEDGYPMLRTLPSGEYVAEHRAPFVVDPMYRPAIFMTVPIGQITVIRDTIEPERTREAIDRADRSGLPVHVEDE